ncbi:MAG: hypothetical protein GVY19_05265 [Bacteroidetes bacterium]|jgi:hypothetical protein|nr:hypothetical protein [Bacteroidota bacterium]
MKDRDSNIEEKFKGLKKSTPFKVPEGYFDEFASRVQERIHDKQQPGLWEKIVQFLKPQLALTTVFATAALIIFVAIKVFIDDDPVAGNNQLSDIYEIYMYDLSEEQIMEMIYATEESTEINEATYEEEIIDYLLNEGFEITELYEEL